MYKINKNEKQLILEDFGYWNYSSGLEDKRELKILSRRRRNLQGNVLKGALVLTNEDSINHMEDMR